jgi:DNA modification methylase
MFTDENTVMLDPTCGSGSALRAAESLGAAYILGVEINGDFTERANLALEASRRMKDVG